MAVGNPAKVRYFIDDERPPTVYARTAMTLKEALEMGHDGGGEGTQGKAGQMEEV